MNSTSTKQASTNGEGKEQEIARLLAEGTRPSELVRQGFSRGTVYKTAARQRAPDRVDAAAEPEIENDPDIVQLKKDLRKTELERQLAAARAELEGPTFEERLANLAGIVRDLSEDFSDLEERVDNSPTADLGRRFECGGCGAKGAVAVRVICTTCRKESSFGYWPKKK